MGTPAALTGAGARSARLVRAWWWRPLACYAASRVLVLAGVAIGAAVHGGLRLHEALGVWDGVWYLQLARVGYPTVVPRFASDVADAAAFFPLYPLAIRALGGVIGSQLAAGAVVATVAGAAACLLLWRLLRDVTDAATADRGVALFSFFPGAAVLSLVYAEGLFLALTIGCLLALRSGRWTAAGIAAALATATRPTGVVLCACCLWAALGEYRRSGRVVAFAAPALAPTGLLAFFAFLWLRTGEPLAWLLVQRHGWGERVDLGRRTLTEVVLALRDPSQVSIVAAVVGLVFAAAAAVLLLRWRPGAELVLYAFGVLGMALVSAQLGARPRFILAAFPLVVAPALVLRAVPFAAAIVVSGTMTLLYSAVIVGQPVALVP